MALVSTDWAKVVLGVVAMGCVTAIECIALFLGIDGTVLSTVVAVLAGLGGYSLSQGYTAYKAGQPQQQPTQQSTQKEN